MSDLTVYATTRTTCHCTKCKREWIKKGSTELVGDLILHPEGCPFCGIEMLRELLYAGHKVVNMGGHLNDQWLIEVNEKLRKYARHKNDCFQGSSFFRVIRCSCGLDALLQEEK